MQALIEAAGGAKALRPPARYGSRRWGSLSQARRDRSRDPPDHDDLLATRSGYS